MDKILKQPNLNYLWSALIVEELIRNGVDHFCVAPGSRSTPLALSVAQNPKANTKIHFDERGLGFYALGLAVGSQKPVAIITTSGTAVANLFPAIVEASKKKLPLIIITADRPPELRWTGSNQTIDQVKIFGTYVKWFFDLPTPTFDIKPEFVLTTVDQLVHQSRGNHPGPVHLNCMFREPLAPTQNTKGLLEYSMNLSEWANASNPFTQYILPKTSIKHDDLQEIINILKSTKNGLIVVGKLASDEERNHVLKLAENLGWPVFADISSGLRLKNHPHVINYFDQILLSEKTKKNLSFDGILHFGGRITSQRYYNFVKDLHPKTYILVLNHPLRNDPNHNVTHRIEAKPGLTAKHLLKNLTHRKLTTSLKYLIKANQLVHHKINNFIATDERICEPGVVYLTSQTLPENWGLFLGNSLPIREMDMYGCMHGNVIDISANRGASGIDGIIASAVGYAQGLKKPVTLVIGDLSFLYDLNSISLIKDAKFPLNIIVINNDGGGIFSFLPVNNASSHFKDFFTTPHGLKFSQVGKLFGIEYCNPTSKLEFMRALNHSIKTKVSNIIEITSDCENNLKVQKKLQNTLKNSQHSLL